MGWKTTPPLHMKTPIQFLDGIGCFSAPIPIIGCLHLAQNDIPLLARRTVKVIYTPIMNDTMKLGELPLGKLVEAGIPVGLGSDLWNSRLGFNMWEDMRLAMAKGSSPLPTAREILHMATMGSARTLGLETQIGS